MTNELHAETTTASTCYCVLLSSVGKIWNGTTFVTIDSGDWTDYDIAMTEATAGIYLADMPTTIPGAYSYVVYIQAGASPAITDTYAGTGWINWSGSAEISATSPTKPLTGAGL